MAITPRNTTVKKRSITSVKAELVMKVRMFSSSRTRATELPTPPCLEIGERQGEQVPEEACPELDIDPVRRMREQIDAKPAHDRFEESDADKADDENVKRGLGLCTRTLSITTWKSKAAGCSRQAIRLTTSAQSSCQPPNPIIRFENAMRPNWVRPLSAAAAIRLQTNTIVWNGDRLTLGEKSTQHAKIPIMTDDAQETAISVKPNWLLRAPDKIRQKAWIVM